MKSLRTIFPVLGIVATIASIGCTATAGTDGADITQTTSDLTAQSPAREGMKHARRGHFGPERLVFAALHENIGLSPEQRATIENLVAQKKAEHAQRPAPDKSRMTTLAAAIRSGNVEGSAVAAPKPDQAAMQARLDASAKELATLHDTLSKEQRVALVDAVMPKKGGEKHDHGQRADKGGERGPLGHLLKGLDVTKEQKEQIRAKLAQTKPSEADREAMKAKFETMKKERDAKLLGFESDTFDAKAFVTPPARPDQGVEGRARMAKELSAVVSVLTPAQREKLAQRIEQGPKAR